MKSKQSKKGILIVNMGGPNSPDETKTFLKKMFCDPHIIPLPSIFRTILAWVISSTRYKKSWKKYLMIKGSPIIETTKKQAENIAITLGDDYMVKYAFSYSKPYIKEGLDSFSEKGISEISVVPLYPQHSLCTSESVINEANKHKPQNTNLKQIKEFYQNKYFNTFWTELINKHLEKHKLNNPVLLFSAHAIPQHLIAKGDKYPEAIEKSASVISKLCQHPYFVSYQSRMGKTKWTGPDTKDVLQKIKEEGHNEVVIIPISFVCENLETLYDLDIEIIPYGKKIGIKNISRVLFPEDHSSFTTIIKSIISHEKQAITTKNQHQS